MERGTVKWFDEEKGYGFITSDIGKTEYFVHSSNIETLSKTLEKGERVEFEIGEGPTGRVQAKKVTILIE
ncbi:MAG: cold shock domain-containing protein [Chlamydiae bacterium]|nr:cold shock domain-containing protein [Chlamydiota bacterium]